MCLSACELFRCIFNFKMSRSVDEVTEDQYITEDAINKVWAWLQHPDYTEKMSIFEDASCSLPVEDQSDMEDSENKVWSWLQHPEYTEKSFKSDYATILSKTVENKFNMKDSINTVDTCLKHSDYLKISSRFGDISNNREVTLVNHKSDVSAVSNKSELSIVNNKSRALKRIFKPPFIKRHSSASSATSSNKKNNQNKNS